MKNYYQILDLEPTCTKEDIKRAYREYAKHFHPDKHKNNEFFAKRFIEVKEAYDVLLNDSDRLEHDIFHGYQKSHKKGDDSSGENHFTRTNTEGDFTENGNRLEIIYFKIFRKKLYRLNTRLL